MLPVETVVWFIESHFGRDLTLEEIADFGGVSRFGMSRSFGAATGRSVMGYVRGRRLTEAAKRLANGAPDILSVALEAGYGSHEAFTRAFRDQFGLTPEQVRAQRHLDNLALLEPIDMEHSPFVKLEPPRFQDGKALLIAGLGVRYTFETMKGIPAQWQRFAPYIGHIAGQVGATGYGVMSPIERDESFDYLAGVEVSGLSEVPEEFAHIRLPAQRYVVFHHGDHVSKVSQTIHAIWNKWLPQSGHEVGDSHHFFERYGAEFDPRTGLGGMEVWIPLKA